MGLHRSRPALSASSGSARSTSRASRREAPSGNRITCGRDGRRPDLSPGHGGGQIVHAPPDHHAQAQRRSPPRPPPPTSPPPHPRAHASIAPVGTPKTTTTRQRWSRLVKNSRKLAVQHQFRHPLSLIPAASASNASCGDTPRPEPVRETEKVRLVDRVQRLNQRPLHDLVLQRGDAERPQPPVRPSGCRPSATASPGSSPRAPGACRSRRFASRSCP